MRNVNVKQRSCKTLKLLLNVGAETPRGAESCEHNRSKCDKSDHIVNMRARHAHAERERSARLKAQAPHVAAAQLTAKNDSQRVQRARAAQDDCMLYVCMACYIAVSTL